MLLKGWWFLIILYSHFSDCLLPDLDCWILGYIKSYSYTKARKQHKSFTARQNAVMDLNGLLKVGFVEMSRDFKIIQLQQKSPRVLSQMTLGWVCLSLFSCISNALAVMLHQRKIDRYLTEQHLLFCNVLPADALTLNVIYYLFYSRSMLPVADEQQ